MTKKHKHRGHSASSTRSHSPSSGSSTKSHNKSVSDSRDYSEVLHVKNKQTRKRSEKQKEESIRKLYVYYTYGAVKGKTWRYNGLPSNWALAKKSDLTDKSKYTKVNVFSGPKKNRDDMKKYLENAFEYLKKKNIVKYYKISSE